MLRLAITLIVFGLVRSQTAQPEEARILNGETEWDCSEDHAAHESDPNKFLQSPGRFAQDAVVFEQTCPTPLQVFSKIDGLCRCLYTPELRDLLNRECQLRPVAGNSRVYDLLNPNVGSETIEGLYQRQSCDDVLPRNIVAFFESQNPPVQPLFFNEVNCSCDWTREALAIRARPVGEGEKCERLVDVNFTSVAVSSDETGNWVAAFPSSRQNNMTVAEGGTRFDGAQAMVMWRPAATDFDDITLLARFRPTRGTTNQLIFTNICRDTGGSRGFVELTYNPSDRRYRLQFFGDQIASCIPNNAPGINADHTAAVTYRDGEVSLEINGFSCDVSSLNPVQYTSPTGGERLLFSPNCPFQIGGAVFTDILQADFGRFDSRQTQFEGIYKRFMITRDCRNPPQMVLDRLRGVA